jgi:hypothetical protein
VVPNELGANWKPFIAPAEGRREPRRACDTAWAFEKNSVKDAGGKTATLSLDENAARVFRVDDAWGEVCGYRLFPLNHPSGNEERASHRKDKIMTEYLGLDWLAMVLTFSAIYTRMCENFCHTAERGAGNE